MCQWVRRVYSSESDTLALAQKAVRDELIDQYVLEHLTSLHLQVPSTMKHKYLLACLDAALKKLSMYYKELPDKYRKYVIVDHTPNTSSTVGVLDTKQLPDLIEILAVHAYKWREIGVALRFQPEDLDNIQACPLLLQNSPKLPDKAFRGLAVEETRTYTTSHNRKSERSSQ